VSPGLIDMFAGQLATDYRSGPATAVACPAGAVEEAHAVLHMAMTAVWPDAGQARDEVVAAVVALGEALRGCQERIGDADASAGAARSADELIRVMSGNCGADWGDAR
jgi:hypothetical protein